MISVSQIYFDRESACNLDAAFYPFNNQFANDDYFENSVIRQIYQMNPSLKRGMQYLGVTSWKQQDYTHMTGKEIVDFIQEDVDFHGGYESDGGLGGKDVYIYCPVDGIEPKLDHSGHYPVWSGTIRQIDAWMGHKQRGEPYKADLMLNEAKVLPFDLFDGKWQYCYRNYWIAKKHVFDEYCEKVLLPAISFFERPEVKNAMPRWYIHPGNGKKYNSCCFTLEGLFGAFLAHSNYTFDYILKKKIQRQYKMVRVDGYEIINNPE